MLKTVINQITPVAIDTLVVAAIAFLGWLTSWLRTRFKINLDEARASAIGIAVANAAGGVLNKLGEKAVSEVVTTAQPSVQEAISYVEDSVPDAVAHFDLTKREIGEKIVNEVGKLTAPALAPPMAKPK